MNLVIVSGLSGSGKSIALNTLEDLGYYCIDNLPLNLLEAFAAEIRARGQHDLVAAGIDARNHPEQIRRFPDIIRNLRESGIDTRILFLQADDATLLKRFSETRRKHPLSGKDTPLDDAITLERRMLAPVISDADLFLDTSTTNVHQLREMVASCIGNRPSAGFCLVLKSFGYKHGIPADADYVFDVRCLPNPYWEPHLRKLTGMDEQVAAFLEGEQSVQEMYNQLENFLETWVPQFRKGNRSYLNIAIGCTGGMHRSVYLVERLARSLGKSPDDIVKRHRELE